MGGHTIVCGLERLSLRVAEALLRLGETVTVVADDPDPELLREARRAGAKVVEGRLAAITTLRGVDLVNARCLVLTDNADLSNLDAAMAAHKINPDLPVVIRMFTEHASPLSSSLLFPNSRAISSSAEAAPHFAAAALGIAATPTRLVWGRHFIVEEEEEEEEEAGADVEPEGWSLRRIRESVQPPRRERRPQIDIGEGHSIAAIEPPPRQHRRPWRRVRQLRRVLRVFFDRRLAMTAVAMGLLVGSTTVLYHFLAGFGWVDALFLTMTTASGNMDPHALPWYLKLYAVGFMLSAAAGLAMLLGLVADAVVGTRILDALGVPHTRMTDHVVVVGLGTVGYRITQHLLDAGLEVAAVEIKEQSRWVRLARGQGVPVLVTDGRYSDSLRLLSVERARAVVAVTDDDLANFEVAVAAREINPQVRIVARAFEPDRARNAQRELKIPCYSVSALAVPAFVAAAMGDGVHSTLPRNSELWLIAEVKVASGSKAEGADPDTLEQAGDLRVAAVRAGGVERWRPNCPQQLQAGNDILAACSRVGWERLRALAAAPSGAREYEPLGADG